MGVRLGGVTRRRSILGGRRNELENWALLLGVVVALIIVFGGQTLPWIGAGFAWLALVFVLVSPTIGDTSPATDLVLWWRSRRREKNGLTRFTPGEPVVAARKGSKVVYGARSNRRPQEAPDWVGRVKPVPVHSKAGGSILVLLHYPVGEEPYASVALEVEAASTGVQSEEDELAGYARWSRFLALAAAEGSMVRSLQQLERVQTVSLAAHTAWLDSRLEGHNPDPLLVESYQDVLGQVVWTAEAHHSLLVVKIPMTAKFASRCIAGFGDATAASRARLAVEQVRALAQQGMQLGVYRRVAALDEDGFAKAIRACMHPGHAFDDEGRLSIRDCWPAYVGYRDHVEVAGQWHTRTARITEKGLPAGVVPVDILRDLATGIYPAVVRTVSLEVELIPAREARRQALSNKALDEASRREALGRVSDGSEDVQALASSEIAADLRPGTGHHAVNFTFHLTVAGEGKRALHEAVAQVENVAGNLSLGLEWLDGAQDLALATTLPLGRGLRRWRPSKW